MNTEQMLEVILQKINSMDTRMENVENKIDSLDARMDSLDARMDSLDARMDSLDARMDSLDARMDSLDARMDSMDVRVKFLESLPQQMKEIQLTLENEISKKIDIIAEGHLDLSRKLDEALEFQKEKEMILLRVTSLEGDVQRISVEYVGVSQKEKRRRAK